MRRKLVPAVLLAVLAFAVQAYGQIKVNVRAQSDEETNLIRQAVSDVYPQLSENHQKLIRDGLYFARYYGTDALGSAEAFGPEDDPEYKPGDKKLYPEGTIKVSFCKPAMEILQLISSTDDKVVRAVFKLYFTEVVAHELTHVEQYMANPVEVLTKPEQCPKGICDKQLTAGTAIKFQYELDAMAAGYEFGRKHITRGDWGHTANWLKAHANALPAGIAEWAELPFDYLNDPVPQEMYLGYGAMYIPVVLAQHCEEAGKLESDDESWAALFLKVNRGSDKDNRHELEKIYPYLTPVFARLESCLKQAH